MTVAVDGFQVRCAMPSLTHWCGLVTSLARLAASVFATGLNGRGGEGKLVVGTYRFGLGDCGW